MSPSIISFPTMLFASFLVLISTSISPVQCRNLDITPTPSSPNYPILETICNDHSIDQHVCINVLQSIPKISLAEGLQNLTIAIIESGISNSTKTSAYIEAAFNQTGAAVGLMEALNECRTAYDQVVQGFSSALRSVKVHDRISYTAASYELLTSSTDYVKFCDDALAKQNVKYEVISSGNNAVPIFGLSAFSAVNQLELGDQSK